MYDKFFVKNIGTVSFLLYGKTILPGSSIEITYDGSIYTAVSGSGGLTPASVSVTLNPAIVDTDYACNTTSVAFTVTLPSAPANGSRINFRDAFGTFATNNLTIARGGTDTIEGNNTFVLNANNQVALLTYNSANTRWTVAAELDATASTNNIQQINNVSSQLILKGNTTVLCDASLGFNNPTMPSPINWIGQLIEIKKTDATGNGVLCGAVSGTINSLVNTTLTRQNQSIVFRAINSTTIEVVSTS
jgi:hypothetical protein